MVTKLNHFFSRSTSIAPLVSFRILFGLILFIGILIKLLSGVVEEAYLSPTLHFSYFGFEFIGIGSSALTYSLYVLLLISCLGILLGYFFKISTFLFLLLFSYFELIDSVHYLNHHYLVVLLGAILFLSPAHKHRSFDLYFKRVEGTTTISAWSIELLKIQLTLVYFYAGFAKLSSSDWIFHAEPLTTWLDARTHLPIIGSLFKLSFIPILFTWSAMIYDLSIGFLLRIPRLRFISYCFVLLFHGLTALLFNIALFPYLMSGFTLLFFSKEWHEKWQNRLLGQQKEIVFENTVTPLKLRYLLYFYLIFQILFPLRCYLYAANPLWKEEAYRYTWRVMLHEKEGSITYYIKSKETRSEGIVDNRLFLTAFQEKNVATKPDFILQFAHYLNNHYTQQGLTNIEVRAECYVTLNGRSSQLYFDPKINLLTIPYTLTAPKNWIYQLEE